MKKFYNTTKQNHNLNLESFDLQGVHSPLNGKSISAFLLVLEANQTSEINGILSDGSPVSRTRFGRSPSRRST